MPMIYSLIREQLIPAPLAAVWDYFSSPGNLLEITPSYMRFRVTSRHYEGPIYPGQIITYKVSPVAGIPLLWVTEITQVKPLAYFVDEQRSGPYRMWHHEHHFEAAGDGTRMKDIVHYRLPLGWLGTLAHGLFVKRQLESLFDYRTAQITRRFGPVSL
ncbi:SRPBCC family protein [Chitinophaga vietnamensis]|uniref:SRPBCC family protein n=1 Tax=Chitinophaga vietnamensis TaxID=2593957 RepID=UPI001178252D|nr:SRPBCC family protein [Chitinophaga vietnamensis]